MILKKSLNNLRKVIKRRYYVQEIKNFGRLCAVIFFGSVEKEKNKINNTVHVYYLASITILCRKFFVGTMVV